MIKKKISHKGDTGRYYKDIPVHAAEGVHESVASIILSLLPIGENILELGAGSGALSCRLTDYGYIVMPIDISRSSWDFDSIELTELDLNMNKWHESVLNGKFNCVIAIEVIEHLENPKLFMRQLFEVTKPGGVCVVTTPNVLCADSVIQLIKRETFYAFNQDEYFCSGHISILPYWLIKLFAEDAGFSLIEIRLVGNLEKQGIKLLFKKCLAYYLRWLRPKNNLTIEGDGNISVIVLRK